MEWLYFSSVHSWILLSRRFFNFDCKSLRKRLLLSSQHPCLNGLWRWNVLRPNRSVHLQSLWPRLLLWRFGSNNKIKVPPRVLLSCWNKKEPLIPMPCWNLRRWNWFASTNWLHTMQWRVLLLTRWLNWNDDQNPKKIPRKRWTKKDNSEPIHLSTDYVLSWRHRDSNYVSERLLDCLEGFSVFNRLYHLRKRKMVQL